MKIVVRFAPSPTGHLHLGGARTALFNWLFARQVGTEPGLFLLRLEDTDRARSQEAYACAIPEALRWLGLEWDGEILRQSERTAQYARALEELLRSGKAYRCYCPQEKLEKEREMARAAGRSFRYPGTCRGVGGAPHPDAPFVLRLAVPEAEAAPVMDRIIGRIPITGADTDDFVLTRSDGSPLYNVCCVVDDHALGVTHVIRGADHVDNTRRQSLIYDALELARPVFAHLPLVAGLSKRQGSTAVLDYRAQGYLPEALVNYIARLGWSAGDQEIFTIDELRTAFRLEDVGHSTARVNPDKLAWINERHLHAASPERLAEAIAPFLPELAEPALERLRPAIEVYKARCRNLIELAKAVRACLIADDEVSLDPTAARELLLPAMRGYLVELANLVERLESFDRTTLKSSMWEQLSARNRGFRQIAPACRLSLIGSSVGPRLLDLMMVLGRESVVKRLRRAAEL